MKTKKIMTAIATIMVAWNTYAAATSSSETISSEGTRYDSLLALYETPAQKIYHIRVPSGKVAEVHYWIIGDKAYKAKRVNHQFVTSSGICPDAEITRYFISNCDVQISCSVTPKDRGIQSFNIYSHSVSLVDVEVDTDCSYTLTYGISVRYRDIPNISLSKKEVSVVSSGGNYTFDVKANKNDYWTLRLDSSCDWISYSPKSGTGNGTVTVTVAANSKTTSRSGHVYVDCLNKSENVYFSQAAAAYTLSTKISTLTASENASHWYNLECSFSVECNGKYVVKASTNDWLWIMSNASLSLKTYETSGSQNILLELSQNTTYDDRKGTITLTTADGKVSKTIVVVQRGREKKKYSVVFNANEGLIGSKNSETREAVQGTRLGDLPLPTRDRYTFEGWFTAKNSGNKVAASTLIDSLVSDTVNSVTLYAHWKFNPRLYTIVYCNNGSLKDCGINYYTNQVYECSEVRLLPCRFWRNGYDFGGWDNLYTTECPDYSDEELVSFAGVDGEYINLQAVWIPKKTYNVQFLTDNGVEGVPQYVTYTEGDVFGQLPQPTRTGYDFNGWFDSASGKRIEADMVVNSSVASVCARWTAKEYALHFDSNGGEGSMLDQKFKFDVSQKISKCLFYRSGYNFAGWNRTGGKDVEFKDEQEVLGLTTGTLQLYAVWSPRGQYSKLSVESIEFENGYLDFNDDIQVSIVVKNDGSAYSSPSKIKVSYFNGGTELGDEYDAKLMEFDGYAEDVYCHRICFNETDLYDFLTETSCIGCDSFEVGPIAPGGRVVIKRTLYSSMLDSYCMWPQYAVAFLDIDKTEEYGSVFGDTVGFGLGGWYDGLEDLLESTVTVGGKVSITIDANGADEIIPLQAVAGDKFGKYLPALTFNGEIPERNGCSLYKWVCKASYNGHEAWVPIASSTKVPGCNVVLKPVWDVAEYVEVKFSGKTIWLKRGEEDAYFQKTGSAGTHVISFNANGGDGEMASQIVCVGSKLDLNAFTRAGYEFIGWSFDENNSPLFSDGEDVDNIIDCTGGSTRLFACWQPNLYFVRFASGGGIGEMSEESVLFGNEFQLPQCGFLRIGYGFEGWTTNETDTVDCADCGMVSNLTDVACGTITLRAVWKAVVSDGPVIENGVLTGWVGELPDNPIIPENVTRIGNSAFCGRDLSSVVIPASVTSIGSKAFSGCTRLVAVYFGGNAPEVGDAIFENTPLALVSYVLEGSTGWKEDGLPLKWPENAGDCARSLLMNECAHKVFLVSEGEILDTVEVCVGGAYSILPKPDGKGNRRFVGWYTLPEGGLPVSVDHTVFTTEDEVLYANWAVIDDSIPYSIVFNNNGGVGSIESMTCYRGKVYKLNANSFKKSGKTFRGWTGSNGKRYDNKTIIFNLAMPDETVEMTAVWE